MTQDDNGNPYTYDAWNRLVATAERSLPETYTYTADSREAATYGCDGGTGAGIDSYYDLSGRLIEVESFSPACGGALSYTMRSQYVWGLDYVNSLVERDDVSTLGSLGISGSGLGVRLYATHDANYNITATTDDSGAVTERFQYDPYGKQTALNASWGAYSGSYTAEPWNVGFQGGVQMYLSVAGGFTTDTGLIQFDNRIYDVDLGRWIQQDPAGYVDGANMYQSLGSDPITRVDPTGDTWVWEHHDGEDVYWPVYSNVPMALKQGGILPNGSLATWGFISATDSSVSAAAHAWGYVYNWWSSTYCNCPRDLRLGFNLNSDSGSITAPLQHIFGTSQSGPMFASINSSYAIDNTGATEHTVVVDVTIDAGVNGTVSSTLGGKIGISGSGTTEGEIDLGGTIEVQGSTTVTLNAGWDRGPETQRFTLKAKCVVPGKK